MPLIVRHSWRSLGSIAAFGLVVCMHLLLLGTWHLPALQAVPTSRDLRSAVPLLSLQMRSVQPSKPEPTRFAGPSPLPTAAGRSTTEFADASAAAPAMSPAHEGSFQAVDGEVILDYQLADIQGASVQLGTMRLSLHVQSGRYESESSWTVGGQQGRSHSQGVSAGLLQPTFYSEDDTGSAAVAVPQFAQDPLAVIWNLRGLVANTLEQSPEDAPMQWFTRVQLADSVQAVLWRTDGQDTLVLPGGLFRAAKVVGTLNQYPRKKTSIWFAIDFGYTPIRVESIDAQGRIRDAKFNGALGVIRGS